MKKIIYIQHGGLYAVIDTEIKEIIDVFQSVVDLLLEYPEAVMQQL